MITRDYVLQQIVKAFERGEGVVAFAEAMHGAGLDAAFGDAERRGIMVMEIDEPPEGHAFGNWRGALRIYSVS